MRRFLWPFLVFLVVIAFDAASAIDVNPSKQTLPPSAWDSGGGSNFSIFSGDPKRIQRANAVDPKSFDCKVEVTPNPLSLRNATAVGPNPSIKISFSVHNHSRKTYTLSFPTTQRWDFRVLNASGGVVYAYTDDHEFLPTIGTTMVNYDDKLVYPESIAFDDLDMSLTPGAYTVQAVLANYPDMKAQVQFIVQP
jgi:hypothetical protein